MFTGMVEAIGTILRREPTGLFIHTPPGLPDVMCGECIGVDGACLTVIERGENWFHVETTPENLRYTRLECLEPGAHVNLECALSTDGPMSGHFVQGHVEATVAVLSVKEDGMKRYCEVECPACLRSSIVPGGLVALNGVSLTVIECLSDRFSFILTPYTLEHTNLGEIQPGKLLNLETEIGGPYVVQRLQQDGKIVCCAGRTST